MQQHIPPDAEWYLAEIVIEHVIEGEADNVVHKNLTLVRADSPEEAYQRATALGMEENLTYANPEGRRVTSRFVGLRALNVIHDKLEHGAELTYSKRIGMSPLELQKWVSKKDDLGVFRESSDDTARS
jgi:hypothetical protein